MKLGLGVSRSLSPAGSFPCRHADFRFRFFLCILFLGPCGGQRAGLLEEPRISLVLTPPPDSLPLWSSLGGPLA